MTLVPDVREDLVGVLDRDPGTWRIANTVLGVVEAHLAGAARGPEDLARAAGARGLPAEATLEYLLAHERSTGALLALSEAFDDLARCRRVARSDAVAAAVNAALARVAVAVRSALARVAEALRPVLDWFGLV